MIVNDKAIMPISASLAGSDYTAEKMLDFLKGKVFNLRIINGEEICKSCGSSKVLNVALLGAATSTGVLELSVEEMKAAIKARNNFV